MPSAEPGSVAPRTSSTSSSTYGNTTVKYTTWRPILALHPRPHRRHRHRSKIQRCGIPKKGKTKLFFPERHLGPRRSTRLDRGDVIVPSSQWRHPPSYWLASSRALPAHPISEQQSKSHDEKGNKRENKQNGGGADFACPADALPDAKVDGDPDDGQRGHQLPAQAADLLHSAGDHQHAPSKPQTNTHTHKQTNKQTHNTNIVPSAVPDSDPQLMAHRAIRLPEPKPKSDGREPKQNGRGQFFFGGWVGGWVGVAGCGWTRPPPSRPPTRGNNCA